MTISLISGSHKSRTSICYYTIAVNNIAGSCKIILQVFINFGWCVGESDASVT